MGQQVIKCGHNQLKKIQYFYQRSAVHNNNPHTLFVAKVQGCTVTAYKSGKVLFQGKLADEEASQWQGSEALNVSKPSAQKTSVNHHNYQPPDNIASMAVIGSDEVGTGDYFGPMTVVAAFVQPADIEWLQKMGVKDSKKLTDEQMLLIGKTLAETIPHSLLILNNEKYNQLRSAGQTQGQMKSILHNQALLNVTEKVDQAKIDGYLVDQFTKPEHYFKAIQDQPHIIKNQIYFKTQGESVHMSVACASIIARYAFLKRMDQLSEQTGLDLPKGAGSGVDDVAATIIRQKGDAFLNKIAKTHFQNTTKARQKV
ncbi:ribonuclease HIII [Tuberibacillus sp. Marseille-P3662]|uniref:ribonuclease HIII n=1 Tax=Tuberibacillus sp. Marseille-P3662 TaxID=1965358 RepID=UPI000A1CB9B2|nr:ribonuclease HIII [Tuberibacillus sp. Marseille-P3662]